MVNPVNQVNPFQNQFSCQSAGQHLIQWTDYQLLGASQATAVDIYQIRVIIKQTNPVEDLPRLFSTDSILQNVTSNKQLCIFTRSAAELGQILIFAKKSMKLLLMIISRSMAFKGGDLKRFKNQIKTRH